MKVLVIPDVHLKPWMFIQADRLLKKGLAEQAVCLMDIPDDWHKQFDLEAYEQTFDAAVRFAKIYPETLWCYGNHDLSYPWDRMESGYSSMAAYTAEKKLKELEASLPENNPIRYVQRIDQVLFSHGGLMDYFVELHVDQEKWDDVDYVLKVVNSLGPDEMWKNESPIWCRPQDGKPRMYQKDRYLQVVGHAPVGEITRVENVISCDVFSTFPDGRPIGTQEFLLLDTLTWEYEGIRA